MQNSWLILPFALGVAGLLLDWWWNRQPKRNQRLDVLYENWRLLPGDLEFKNDDENDE